jgi:hypothetical protein
MFGGNSGCGNIGGTTRRNCMEVRRWDCGQSGIMVLHRRQGARAGPRLENNDILFAMRQLRVLVANKERLRLPQS